MSDYIVPVQVYVLVTSEDCGWPNAERCDPASLATKWVRDRVGDITLDDSWYEGRYGKPAVSVCGVIESTK